MAMPTPSSLISQIHHLLKSDQLSLNMSIVLRNLNVLLVCLRNTSDDDDDISYVKHDIFSRIQDVMDKVPIDISLLSIMSANLDEVECLVNEVNDELFANIMSDRLTLDDVVEAADYVLDNITDFRQVVMEYRDYIPDLVNQRCVMDEFEVQIRFLRDFLLFAKQTCVENQQLQNLLIHIRTFIMHAACLFHMDAPHYKDDEHWIQGVQSKCPRVGPQVFHSYTQTLLSVSMLDQSDDAMLMGFVSSLISLLWHVLRYHRHPSHSDTLKTLYERLKLSRFIFRQRQRISKDDLEDHHSGILIRDAAILICSLFHNNGDPPSLLDLLKRFDVVQAHMPLEGNSFKTDALELDNSTSMEEIYDGKVHVETTVATYQSTNAPPKDVGFKQNEVSSILDRLTRGSQHLRLIPISGMTGLRKTTFALRVYNHPSVAYRFQARAWCTISQDFDRKRVLLHLLDQIQPGDYLDMTEDDLANKLRQSLKGKRYLIFLDDIWTPQVWESLRPSFPNDCTQSRMVLTSRLHAIIPCAFHDEQPYFLRMRTDDECLEIIEMILLKRAEGLREELVKFAKICKGLPLTAILVAGLLSTTVQEGWEDILDHLSMGGISRMEQCKIALELSYKNLPDDLKLCFLYFGVFPEDEEIYAKKLILLWIAEGFVTQKQDFVKKGARDIAQEYLENLIQRNLIIVSTTRSTGGVKTCRIHDLLHDFCLIKGKQANLFHLFLQRNGELSDFNEPCNLERLSIHSDGRYFKESELFCPRAHSILLFHGMEMYPVDMSFIIQIYKILRVLDMDLIHFNAEIYSEIGLLTQLAYLSINCYGPAIPSSIGKLSNLETLITSLAVKGEVKLPLPYTIWDLHKLIYLSITGWVFNDYGFTFPNENIENCPNLLALETIRGVEFSSKGLVEKQMRKFPNIRRLSYFVSCEEESSEELNKIFVVPKYCSKLESITLFGNNRFRCDFDFGSTAKNIRKLTLHGFLLSREEIAILGKLANLEVLKLVRIDFLWSRMEMEEGEFSKLRIFILHGGWRSNLETWTITEDEQLPCLEKLVFRDCMKLKEIPYSCLETSSTLEEIDVYGCSSALGSLVRDIEEVQKDFGNLIKVNIYPPPEVSESKEAGRHHQDGFGLLDIMLSCFRSS